MYSPLLTTVVGLIELSSKTINNKNMKQHNTLREYVKMLTKSDATSLVIKGNGGLGKSYTVMDEIEKLGFKENIHYIYVAGHMTPLQLFNTISKTATLEPPKLIVFDDIDSLITNKVSIALLKSALGEVRGKRIVSYNSTSSKIDGPTSIDFTGKVIMILNELRQEQAFGKPLLDRCIVFDMALSQDELIEYVEMIIPDIQCGLSTDNKWSIWKDIKQFSGNPRFSIRSLVRAFEFYKYDPNKWHGLFASSLKLNDAQKIEYEMQNSKTKEKVEEYIKRTGNSRATYFREKSSLKVSDSK